MRSKIYSKRVRACKWACPEKVVDFVLQRESELHDLNRIVQNALRGRFLSYWRPLVAVGIEFTRHISYTNPNTLRVIIPNQHQAEFCGAKVLNLGVVFFAYRRLEWDIVDTTALPITSRSSHNLTRNQRSLIAYPMAALVPLRTFEKKTFSSSEIGTV
ncbi:hypothetical protein Q1695_004670 [Nippostrongylus brasiliensis]|nr:hypothetical protein Q1695_004670 [Nippostrongylus brasiliensis]